MQLIVSVFHKNYLIVKSLHVKPHIFILLMPYRAKTFYQFWTSPRWCDVGGKLLVKLSSCVDWVVSHSSKPCIRAKLQSKNEYYVFLWTFCSLEIQEDMHKFHMFVKIICSDVCCHSQQILKLHADMILDYASV